VAEVNGNGGRDPEQLYLQALNHPVRRKILRLFLGGKYSSISPTRASALLSEEVSRISYHMGQLVGAGLMTLVSTRPVRGAIEHFYAPVPTALKHPIVEAVLSRDEKK
jgi:DNA-binding transcriptional ArsR family regulator